MIGNAFGQYVILEKIGQGGMGEVFLADDTSLQRKVALKFLPPALADSPESRERFIVEAQAAAALSHPNICVIHEVGETEGKPFIAMEYVEGDTLRERIRAGTLENEEVLSIIRQVAAGLEEAHGKGVIHRDIKSSNIMVTAKGQTKIMDFGLAKVRGGPALTMTRTTLGTAAYMSPEQAAGDEVDHRTDLWSAGVVLYEMLTGELPFPGDRETAVVYHILNDPPKPFKDLKPPTPAALQRVAARALKKDPDRRYGSAGEMLADLGRFEEELRAETASAINPRWFLSRLRRPTVAVPTAVAVVALGVLGFWFAQRRADIRWARGVALPEIERMIGENDVWRNMAEPYRLAEQAEAILGDDPELVDLISQVSLNIDIQTEPPGASIYMKEYGDPDGEWTYLGVSPMEKVRMPVGIFRWKIEKEGHETVLAAASSWNSGSVEGKPPGTVIPFNLVRTLDEEGSLPPGMVRVPATQTGVGPLPEFFIGRYEVTNREYKDFLDAGGYRDRDYWEHPFLKDGGELTLEEAINEMVDPSGQPGPSTWLAGDYPEGQGEHPVSGVSWYEAAAYAEYAGKSLPTRFHWLTGMGYFTPMVRVYQYGGDMILAPFANFGGSGTVPVGSLPSLTPYGAYDMGGNVREWCWNETPEGRMVRGGAWDENTYMFRRQSQAPPMDRSARNGIRLALYPHPEEITPEAFRFEALSRLEDLRARQPVPDEVFQVYREQFSYDTTALNEQVESREESPGGWVHELVTFDAAYGGERVLGHLFLPSNAPPPYQTVVYFPGSAAAYMTSSAELESYYEFPMFLSFLVKNGRAVLFPVYKGTFERGDPALAAIHSGADSYAYTEYLVQTVKDLRRSLDYLETRPDIDSGKLAFYGMSWGGWLGAIVPAVEERFGASVLVGGGLGRPTRPEAHTINYVTRVRTPTLMLNGKYDIDVDARIRPMFDLLGTPTEDKSLILYETDHIPPRAEYIKETIAWLDKYLGPVNR